MALIYTIVCCIVAIIIAGISASNKKDKEWFENLNHSDNSFMLKIMNKYGIIFFLMFGFVLYHLIISHDIVSIVIMITIIQLMGLSPLLIYKTKNLKLSFIVMLIIPILVSVLIFLLLQEKSLLVIPIILFLLWSVYDFSYYYRLMKLNK